MTIELRIKELLINFQPIKDSTPKKTNNPSTIDYKHNPLDPNLLSYCFDVILGFKVRYRIFEKMNFFIEFDYKGTLCKVYEQKMSYDLIVEREYKNEIIQVLEKTYRLLVLLFLQKGKESLIRNDFTMVNEFPKYLEKMTYYQNQIEKLDNRYHIISDKVKGQFDVRYFKNGASYSGKCSEYLRNLAKEIIYNIEAYVATIFSCLEHYFTLLYPFMNNFNFNESYCNRNIHNTKWSLEKKIENIANGDSDILEYIRPLRKLKEIFRNRQAHGMFSRELYVYTQIDKFGRFPMYLGKEYLIGFAKDIEEANLSYEKYEEIKNLILDFMNLIERKFPIPCLLIKNGLDIPVETKILTAGIDNLSDAEKFVHRYYYELDNQMNMDW